jgi:hypothetical protein
MFKSKIWHFEFEIWRYKGIPGIYAQISPESIYFLTRPTDPLPEGVEGKPEIRFDRPYYCHIKLHVNIEMNNEGQ